LELSEESEVHHHASYHKKNRFVLLDVNARVSFEIKKRKEKKKKNNSYKSE